MSLRSHRLLAWLAPAVVAMALAPHAAYASDADDADQHFKKGTTAYNIQDWDGAIKELREAYRLDPQAKYLWAIAQAQRQSGDCKAAILTYKAWQRTASPEQFNQAQESIQKCEAIVRDQALHNPAGSGAALSKDEEKAKAEAALRKDYDDKHSQWEASKPNPWYLDPLGDILLVVGVGGTVAGSVILAMANSDMSATASAPTYQQADHGVDAAASKQKIGLAIGGAGLAFTVLAVWRLIAVAPRVKEWRGREPGMPKELQPTASLGATPLPGGGFISYSLRF